MTVVSDVLVGALVWLLGGSALPLPVVAAGSAGVSQVARPAITAPAPRSPSPVRPAPAPTDLGPSPLGARRAPDRGWAWPLGPPHAVLRRFEPPAQRWGAGHRGVDLGAGPGTVVAAPTDGVVTFVGVIAGRGVLVVSHAGGLRSTFEPVAPLVEVGNRIRRGQPVALLDLSLTGHCGPVSCLHWGVIRDESYLDPLAFVRARVALLPLS